MADDQSCGRNVRADDEQTRLGRRPILRSLGAMGALGALGGAASDPALADHVSSWPEPSDAYYSTLVEELSGQDLPPASFVYAANEADTAAAYEVGSSIAETSDIDVGTDAPFSQATRIQITEEPANSYDVTYIATAPNTAISQGDVLLGVVYLRGPEASQSTPTVQYVAKDEDNLSSNMVTGQAQVRPGSEWQRYYFPMQFDYDSEAGTWRTEMFLGFGQQTIDIGGMAVLYFADDTTPDALPSGQASGGQQNGGDWEAAADQRIQEHRTADLTVEVVDTDGTGVPDADVEVSMQEHAFGFGTAFSADHLLNNTAEGDPYRENITDLFNTVVLGNFHKWRFWETGESTSDRATQWALNQGFDVRGHVCLWANISSWAVPPDVVRAMGVTWEDNGVTDPQLDPDYVRQRTLDHIEAIIEDYGDHIEEWEVVNELYHQPGMVRAINGVPADQAMDGDPMEAAILAEWFDTAREAAPEETTLAVNDYNTLSGPYFDTRDAYQRQIQFLNENSSLDSVGLQCHFNEGSTLSPQQIKDGLDSYAQHDVTLQITEFDMADEGWAEEDKATFFRQFLKMVFSHEAVDEFLIWGIHSDLHWRDDAPFYRSGSEEEWVEKPPLQEYRSLVFDEWWTEESGTADSQGVYSTTGFKGEYEITASDGSVTRTVTATLEDGSSNVEVALDPNATPEPTPEPVDLPIGDTEVTTPEGGIEGSVGTPTNTPEDDDATPTPTTSGPQAGPAPDTTETTETSGQPGLGVISGLAGIAGLGGYLLRRDDGEEE